LQEHFARQFNDLQQWEQTMIIASLQRVAYMMDAEHIDASPVLDVGTLDRSMEPSSSIEPLAAVKAVTSGSSATPAKEASRD
jgi:hypothetical protein